MPFLEFGGQRRAVPAGTAVLGSGPECQIRVEAAGAAPRHASLTTDAGGSVSIRRLEPSAEVLVNGVRLGDLPQPLLHGDKVSVAGTEILFVDERQIGGTQYVPAADLPPLRSSPPAFPAARPTVAAAGAAAGRVVCQTDGREYHVGGGPLIFGRDASASVVVAGADVSRQHAEIVLRPEGYVIVDRSTNGTFVNGERVQGERLLARSDMIRIGPEEFRFYAEAPAPPPPPPPPPPPRPAPEPEAAEPRRTRVVGARRGPQPPASEAAPKEAPLARFLVRSGGQKGQRLNVRVPVVNVGRAEFNDLVLTDDSVSTQHAKLMRRGAVWVLADLDSTNGTFVDGERIAGETPLSPGSIVKFGEVQIVFEPTDDEAELAAPKATRMMGAVQVPTPPAPPPPPSAAPAEPIAAAAPVVERRGAGRPEAGGRRLYDPPRPAAAAERPSRRGEEKKKGCFGVALLFVSATSLALAGLLRLLTA